MKSTSDDNAAVSNASGREGSSSPVDALAALLEEEIVLGRLNPRERLIEDELIQRFGAKRHIVRQALFQLETGGLVERIPNRGAYVRSYSPEEVENLYNMRELLEVAAAERLPLPASNELISALKSIQSRHDNAVHCDDFKNAFRANIDFHRTLYSACGNQYLSENIKEFAQKAHAIRFISTTDAQSLQQAREEHHLIIAALEHQDRQRLVELCRAHLHPSKQRYIQLYRRRNAEPPAGGLPLNTA